MKQVSLKEVGGTRPEPEESLASKVEAIQKEHSQLGSQIDLINTRIQGIETAISKQDTSAQMSLNESIKAGNQLIEKSMQDQALHGPLQSVMDAVKVMTAAVQAFASKRIEVNVQQPEAPVSRNKIYKVKRYKHTDRIDEIEERDA